MKLLSAFFICIAITGCSFFKVDDCLDQGGRWDEQKEECIYHES